MVVASPRGPSRYDFGSPREGRHSALSGPDVYSDVGGAMDWAGCDEVEQVPGKVSGVPILKGTRVQSDAITENYDEGFTAQEVADMFRLDLRQVQAVLDFASQRRADQQRLTPHRTTGSNIPACTPLLSLRLLTAEHLLFAPLSGLLGVRSLAIWQPSG